MNGTSLRLLCSSHVLILGVAACGSESDQLVQLKRSDAALNAQVTTLQAAPPAQPAQPALNIDSEGRALQQHDAIAYERVAGLFVQDRQSNLERVDKTWPAIKGVAVRELSS